MNRTLLNPLLGALLLSATLCAHAEKPAEAVYDATIVTKGTFTQDYYFVTDSHYNPNAGTIGATGLSSLFSKLEVKVLDQSGAELTTDWLSKAMGTNGIRKAIFNDKSFTFDLAASTQYTLRVSGTSLQENASFVIKGASIQTISSVPEPETFSMLLAGLAVVGAVASRRARKRCFT